MKNLPDSYCIVDSTKKVEILKLIALQYGYSIMGNIDYAINHLTDDKMFVVRFNRNRCSMWSTDVTIEQSLKSLKEDSPFIKKITYEELLKY